LSVGDVAAFVGGSADDCEAFFPEGVQPWISRIDKQKRPAKYGRKLAQG